MKTYKIEITEEQKNKLIVFLIQYLPSVVDSFTVYSNLEDEYTDKPNFRKNKEYYKLMYSELSELKETLDNLPF